MKHAVIAVLAAIGAAEGKLLVVLENGKVVCLLR